MAILKMINVHIGKNATLKGIINYVLKPKKTEEKLVTGFGCDIPRAFDMMMETKNLFGKLTGRQYYHAVQSFAPNENITPAQAHEVGIKFVEACRKLWGYELILATHVDRLHIHNHFVWNSVNFADGHKFHITRKELAEMKEFQNQICIKMGLSAAPQKGFDMFGKKRTKARADDAKTHHVLKNAEKSAQGSYLQDCSQAVQTAIKLAKTREQFIQLMKEQGFDTEWKLNKKHIVFTDIKRKMLGEKKCKTRLYKLAQYFPELKDFQTKENLLYGIYNKRNHITTVNSNQRKNGPNGSIIDFNARFEQYSAEVNRKRTERAAAEHARQAAENAGYDSECTRKKRPDNTRSIGKDTGYSGASW